MKSYVLLKLLGLAILTMIALVLLSFLEVAVYSYLIEPGHEQPYYEAHAEQTAPFVSGIFGFIIFFFVARYWRRSLYSNALRLALLFPIVYIALDVVLITSFGANWGDYIVIFVAANAAKLMGSLLGHALSAPNLGATNA